MSRFHDELGLRRVINGRGTYTPLGVSRSPEPVARAVAESLRHFVDMEELAEVAGQRIAALTGAEWGTVTNCTAASITLSVAAIMTGGNPTKVRQLPDTRGMKRRVVMQAGHLVDYGQPIEQAVRLSGAEVTVAGSETASTSADLEAALSAQGVACLLLVSSRLCRGEMVSAPDAVTLARGRGIPTIMDAAAQDLRLAEVIATGADLVLTSAQKYLSAATAGLVLGRREYVEALRAQEKGIGRGMKAGKEAVAGVLAALQYRHDLDMAAWAREQDDNARAFASELNTTTPLRAELVPDPTGMPFSRVRAWVDPKTCGRNAEQLATALAAGDPLIALQDHENEGQALMFETVGMTLEEMEIIRSRIASLIS
jgi:L-seryl-tRNA(Ser) seleniumtransferase